MPSEVVECPRCEGYSETIYRCDLCGYDLAEHELQVLDERPDQDLEDLVDVAFPYTCVECGERQDLELDYADLGLVIRVGCRSCGETVPHCPRHEQDVDRQHWDLIQDDSPADQPDELQVTS